MSIESEKRRLTSMKVFPGWKMHNFTFLAAEAEGGRINWTVRILVCRKLRQGDSSDGQTPEAQELFQSH